MLAIVLAVIEIVFALFIIFNVATRFSAFVLAVVMAVGTYYVHDFWNMTGDEQDDECRGADQRMWRSSVAC